MPKKSYSKNKRQLTLRIPKELHRAVSAVARKNQRSLNTEIVWAIYQSIKDDNWAMMPPKQIRKVAIAQEFVELLRPK